MIRRGRNFVGGGPRPGRFPAIACLPTAMAGRLGSYQGFRPLAGGAKYIQTPRSRFGWFRRSSWRLVGECVRWPSAIRDGQHAHDAFHNGLLLENQCFRAES